MNLFSGKTTEISVNTALNKSVKAIKLGQLETIYRAPNNLAM